MAPSLNADDTRRFFLMLTETPMKPLNGQPQGGIIGVAITKPGCKLPMTEKQAIISPCGQYRYILKRQWDPSCSPLTFVMFNPSTADADIDDPTIRRCMSFAKRDGYGGIVVVNLFALRSTDPRAVGQHINPEGPENRTFLRTQIAMANLDQTRIVCAWGAPKTAYWGAKRFMDDVKAAGINVWCLKKTKDGHPGHPLYIPNDKQLEAFS